MQYLRVGYTITWLFISTWGFTNAYMKDESSQYITPAKVMTNLLKVPWINLNSSWTDKVAPACRDDITTLFESAAAGEMWALQMLDAASKIPSGILNGNIRDLGMYEECIRAKSDRDHGNIQGRHCMVSLSMPPKFVGDASETLFMQKLSPYNPTPNVALNFAPSLCLPSSCGVEDIAGLVNASVTETPELAAFEVRVAQVTCSSVDASAERFTVGTFLAILFFAVVALFLISCTACDFMVKLRPDNASIALRTLAKFSLYTAAMKLWSTELPPESMPAINGIRFISTCCIVAAHRILSKLILSRVNLPAILEARDSWMAPFVTFFPYVVDTFFILSGFLSTYLFLNRLRTGPKFTVLDIYLHRYLRLAPCVVALLLFDIFIFPLLGSGPLWEIVVGVTSDYCRKNWWTNLLYIQNFVNQEEMCMPHTWYLAVEMQLFWISPILQYPLFHRPKLGLLILSVMLIAAFVMPAVHLVVNQYSILFSTHITIGKNYEQFVYFYAATYNRAVPHFIGILLGYYVTKSKRRLTKVQTTSGWILACLFVQYPFWTTLLVQPVAYDYNIGWEVASATIGRLICSLVVAWILYACTQGYGGPVTRFLSLPIFVPLSRLSYCIYLVSAVIQVGINATQKTAEFTSVFTTVYQISSDLVASIVVAFVFSLCFETPAIVLEKILKTKRSPEITDRHLVEKKEKLLAVIQEYPIIANGRAIPNSVIQTNMFQPDFWQTVSDVLNISGKNPTKTPAEWMKTWEDWKSDVSKDHSRLKNFVNDIQNGSTDLETRKVALEKEFLLFLAAVNCDLEDVASIERSEITGPPKFELVSHDSRN